jgi:hypothetical protein
MHHVIALTKTRRNVASFVIAHVNADGKIRAKQPRARPDAGHFTPGANGTRAVVSQKPSRVSGARRVPIRGPCCAGRTRDARRHRQAGGRVPRAAKGGRLTCVTAADVSTERGRAARAFDRSSGAREQLADTLDMLSDLLKDTSISSRTVRARADSARLNGFRTPVRPRCASRSCRRSMASRSPRASVLRSRRARRTSHRHRWFNAARRSDAPGDAHISPRIHAVPPGIYTALDCVENVLLWLRTIGRGNASPPCCTRRRAGCTRPRQHSA